MLPTIYEKIYHTLAPNQRQIPSHSRRFCVLVYLICKGFLLLLGTQEEVEYYDVTIFRAVRTS